MIYRSVRLKGSSGEVFVESKAPDGWSASTIEILMRTAIDGYKILELTENKK